MMAPLSKKFWVIRFIAFLWCNAIQIQSALAFLGTDLFND